MCEKLKFALLLVCASFLVACAEQPRKNPAMVPVEDRHAPVDEQTISRQSSSIDKPEPTVIASLISEADKYAASGNTDSAVVTIERALRIEPRNARLWHQFAKIRLQQQNWQQAIALARKSNALVTDDPALKSSNWEIIARSYEQLGNKQKAREARENQRLSG